MNYRVPETYVNLDPSSVGFATGNIGGAWTLMQAKILFEYGHNIVYCACIDKMQIFKACSMAEAAEFFETQEPVGVLKTKRTTTRYLIAKESI
jgi:hypothetical protein